MTSIESYQYTIQLIDQSGQKVKVEVLGIERISSTINAVNIEDIACLFHVNAREIGRPLQGSIDLLLGVQYAAYHPVRQDSKGHLLLLANRFGQTVAGSHPSIKEETKVDVQCAQVKHAVVMFAVENADRFYSIESLGVMCQPRCGSCRCGKCHPGGKDMSLKDEQEHDLIESKITFDVESGRWVAAYPWIKEPKLLTNNRSIAAAILRSTERRLLRNSEQAALYSRQIQDMLDRGAARKVTEEELSRYKGTKFYIAHHAVLKPESKSTPCRIVFNSSAKYAGLSLNDCLAKGPSLLNMLLGVLLRFRQGKIGFIGDI